MFPDIYQSEKSWFWKQRVSLSSSLSLSLTPDDHTDLRHDRQERRNPVLFGPGLRFVVPCSRDSVCARANWPIDERATPVASSFIPFDRPRTASLLILTPALTFARAHGTIRGRELLLKNESDVKLRPDWFTSEATSLGIHVGRAGSTIGNLPR